MSRLWHVFYRKLNEFLAEAGFDKFVESICEVHYARRQGRPGIPPGVYFRMLLVGYFEGITSQRGIAWRCADNLSLREFLEIPVTDESPDHSSLTRIRNRLPLARFANSSRLNRRTSVSCLAASDGALRNPIEPINVAALAERHGYRKSPENVLRFEQLRAVRQTKGFRPRP